MLDVVCIVLFQRMCETSVSRRWALCFVFIRRHALKRNQPIAHHPVSTLTPVHDSPSVFSFFASFYLLPRLWNIWVSAQMNRHTEILANLSALADGNPCGAMDVSAQSCGLHEHHCMSVSVRSHILACVLRSPRDTHFLHTYTCLYVGGVSALNADFSVFWCGPSIVPVLAVQQW